MWTIIVLIYNVGATKEAVTCDVRFTANGGPYNDANLERQFVYTHPTSTDEIVEDLTQFASRLKASFDAPNSLDGRTWEV